MTSSSVNVGVFTLAATIAVSCMLDHCVVIRIIITRQFISRRNNVASHHKGAVQFSLLVLWKQLVSEVGTSEKCLQHVFDS